MAQWKGPASVCCPASHSEVACELGSVGSHCNASEGAETAGFRSWAQEQAGVQPADCLKKQSKQTKCLLTQPADQHSLPAQHTVASVVPLLYPSG